MKIGTVMRATASLSASAIALSCLVAAPANADPKPNTTRVLVGTGSDTTQDVLNGLSTALGTNGNGELYVASYDATSTNDRGTDFIYPAGIESAMFRPNGSSQGRDVLRAAIGQSGSASGTTFAGTTATWNSSDVKDYIDFARSSSGAPADQVRADGVLTYIPFAVDGMTYATAADSVIPNLTLGTSTIATNVDGVTGKVESTLYAIYRCAATRVIDDGGNVFLADDSYTGAGTSYDLNAYIPQAGSGTRSYWIGKFGLTEDTISSTYTCLSSTIAAGSNAGGSVQEHNGSATVGDVAAIMPFSIPQWVGQANGAPGVSDRRFGAVLRTVGGVAPITGEAGAYLFNSGSWTSSLKRSMYNIVPSVYATDTNSAIYETFVGANSRVCQATAAIQAYGFGISGSCGDTSVKAYAASIPTLSMTVASATASALTISAGLVSNGNGGGTVVIKDAGTEIARFAIENDATSANYALNLAGLSAGDVLTAEIIPNLPGVAGASTEFTVKKISTVTATTANVRLTVAPRVVVTVAGEAGIVPSGTVKVHLTTAAGRVLATGTLSGGRATVVLPRFTTVGAKVLYVEYVGSANYFGKTVRSTVTILR